VIFCHIKVSVQRRELASSYGVVVVVVLVVVVIVVVLAHSQ